MAIKPIINSGFKQQNPLYVFSFRFRVESSNDIPIEKPPDTHFSHPDSNESSSTIAPLKGNSTWSWQKIPAAG